jgi:hypothetical protein
MAGPFDVFILEEGSTTAYACIRAGLSQAVAIDFHPRMTAVALSKGVVSYFLTIASKLRRKLNRIFPCVISTESHHWMAVFGLRARSTIW